MIQPYHVGVEWPISSSSSSSRSIEGPRSVLSSGHHAVNGGQAHAVACWGALFRMAEWTPPFPFPRGVKGCHA